MGVGASMGVVVVVACAWHERCEGTAWASRGFGVEVKRQWALALRGRGMGMSVSMGVIMDAGVAWCGVGVVWRRYGVAL